MDDTAFLDNYLNSELKRTGESEPEKLKTFLAYIGLERLKREKLHKYSESDLKKMAGELTSRYGQGVVIKQYRG